MIGRIPLAVPVVYALASAAAFAVYAADKSAARRGAWRTPEITLHALAVAGGWPGALMAQGALRHKNRKPAFQVAFWVTVTVNCAVLAWLAPGLIGGAD